MYIHVGCFVKFVVFRVKLVFWLSRTCTWKTLVGGGGIVLLQGRLACGLHSKESALWFSIFGYCLGLFCWSLQNEDDYVIRKKIKGKKRDRKRALVHRKAAAFW